MAAILDSMPLFEVGLHDIICAKEMPILLAATNTKQLLNLVSHLISNI